MSDIVGTKIRVNDYNDYQKKIAAIWGAGGVNPNTNVSDTKYGYGQNLQSSQVLEGKKIAVSEWKFLISDIVNTWVLQNGINLTQPLSTVLNRKLTEEDGNKIKSSDLIIRSISSNVCNTNILLNLTITQISENQVCHTSIDHELEVGYIFKTASTNNGFSPSIVYYVVSIVTSNQFIISRSVGGNPETLIDGTGLSITATGSREIQHGLSLGDTFVPKTTTNGFVINTLYYIRSVDSLSEFTVSTTPTGAIHNLIAGTGLTIIGTSSAHPYRYLDDIITSLDNVSNRFNSLASIVEYSRVSKTRNINFTTIFSTTVLYTFQNADQARWFFNSGGRIEIGIVFNSSLQSNQSLQWQSYFQTLANNTPKLFGNPSLAINFHNLTSENKFLVNQNIGGDYSINTFRLGVRTPDTSSSVRTIEFQFILEDVYIDPDPPGGPLFAPSDLVDGDFSITIKTSGPDFIIRPAGQGSFIKHFPDPLSDPPPILFGAGFN